jgi:hypothetical protein
MLDTPNVNKKWMPVVLKEKQLLPKKVTNLLQATLD